MNYKTTPTLLALSFHFPPSLSAGVFRTLRFAKYLPEFGWRPIVLSVDPEDGKQCDLELARQVPEEVVVAHAGIAYPDDQIVGAIRRTVLRKQIRQKPLSLNGHANDSNLNSNSNTNTNTNNGNVDPRPNLLRNLWQMAFQTPDRSVWWMREALPRAMQLIRQYEPSVIYSTGPPHSTHLIAAKLKRTTGLPWVCDFRDPWARKPWGLKRRNVWGQRIHHSMERRCIQQADVVILNTQRMTHDFQSHYRDIPAERFITITNGFDPDMIDGIEAMLDANKKCRPTDDMPFTLVHAGALYGRRDPRALIDALAILKERGENVAFQQVGGCSDRFDMNNILKSHPAKQRIEIIPRQPHAKAMQYLAAADGLVVIQPDTELQVPGKLYEMMLFRKPIVALTGDGETADIVNRYRLGVVAPPDDPERIADSIGQLIHVKSASIREDWDAAQAAFDGRNLTARLADVLRPFARATVH